MLSTLQPRIYFRYDLFEEDINGTVIYKTAQVKIVSDDIKSAINSLPLEEKQKLAEHLFASLPVEAKAKALQKELNESGLIVMVGGANSISADICFQIQNAPNIDLPALIELLVERHKSDRKRQEHSKNEE